MGIFQRARNRIGSAVAGNDIKQGMRQVERLQTPIKPPFPRYNWDDCIGLLTEHPQVDNETFAAVMGFDTTNGGSADENPIVQRYRDATIREVLRRTATEQPSSDTNDEQQTEPPPPVSKTPLKDGPTAGQGVKTVQSGDVSLVTFSSQELLMQVQEQRNRVSFDLTGTAKFMDSFNQVWSWAGPILFALGTIGEIFLVLWQRQTEQNWFTGATIIAVSLIAEGTLLAISFSSKRLRNRAEKRSTGWTDKEKHKLTVLKQFWLALAVGVAATQIAFVVAQTDPKGIGIGGIWIIAIVRAMSALVADAYTAFVSEEKPTSGELAIEQQDKETEYTKKVLEQKAIEVDTLNAGSIKVQEVGIKAEMDQDRMNTQKEIAKMQNRAQIESMRTEQEQKVMIDRMRNSAMRAVFDPDMDPREREQILNMLTGLAGATKKLPQPVETTIVEEKNDI